MKKFLKTVAFIALSAFITSCSSDSSNDPGTIAEIASKNANLSTLVSALDKTGLTSTFNNAGDYTVFAPTNDKFQAFLTANGFANLDAVPIPVLTEILKNHVLTGSLNSNELTTGYVKTLAKGAASNTNTLSMYIETGATVKLNGGATNGGASVVTADIQASNGVIHIVDNVIGLPTIVNHAIANSNFSSLVGALTGAGQPDFVSILSGTGPFTVFAPNNSAFTSLDAELPSGIAGVSAEDLTKVLQYHVVSPANVLSSSLTEGQIVTPILSPSQTFTILLSGGARIEDANNRECTIILTDVQASNGVIHVLNKVLLPAL